MLWLAAAALTASTLQPPHPNMVAAVQAKATVRIVSGARIKFGSTGDPALPKVRKTVLRTNGTVQPAQLIEFE